MHICYDDKTYGEIDIAKLNRMNPNNVLKKHIQNYFYLNFMFQNGTWQESKQAAKELTMCEKKMKWWKSRYGYCEELFQKEFEKTKKMWNGG